MGVRREHIKNAIQICIAKKHQPVMYHNRNDVEKIFTMLLSYHYKQTLPPQKFEPN